MKPHRHVAAILAATLLLVSLACGDPDPFGALDRLIAQPADATEITKAAHAAYRRNPTLYVLDYAGQQVTIRGHIDRQGEDWATVTRRRPIRVLVRCEFSDHIRDLANVDRNAPVSFRGTLDTPERGVLTLKNCRQAESNQQEAESP